MLRVLHNAGVVCICSIFEGVVVFVLPGCLVVLVPVCLFVCGGLYGWIHISSPGMEFYSSTGPHQTWSSTTPGMEFYSSTGLPRAWSSRSHISRGLVVEAYQCFLASLGMLSMDIDYSAMITVVVMDCHSLIH